MKNVLIFTYYFPPINAIASRRYGQMAPYMKEFGWNPTIVTTHSQGDLPIALPEKQIIRIGENCDSGKTLVSGEGGKGIPSFLKPLYAFYRRAGFELTSVDRFLFSWGKEVLARQEIIKETKPDVIIGTYLPAVALWLARMYSRKLNVPWVADFRDACSLYNPSSFPLAKSLDRVIDKFLVRNADAVLTISPHLASLLKNFYHKPTEVIYNGFDTPLTPERSSTGISKEPSDMVLYYAGRFHPHRVPAAKLLIDWLAMHKAPVSFKTRSLGPLEANKALSDYAKQKGVSDKVTILPPATHDVIAKEERDADVLLVFEDVKKMNPISQTNMTGKLFEYLPFAAPILAVTRADSDIGVVLDDTLRGFLASNITELDYAMGRIRSHDLPSPDYKNVSSYSRNMQCKKLCRVLDRVVS